VATPPPKSRKRPITRAYTPLFEAFWKIYPRKAGKADAFDMWTRALDEGITADTMTDGARRYAASRRGQDPQFTKTAAAWIHGARWQDAPTLRAVASDGVMDR